MATKSMSYDHPCYTARRIAHLKIPAAAAQASAKKFVAYTDIKVKSINIMVQIAGTSDTAGYDVSNGTTSIGAFTLGTGAIGTLQSAIESDQTLSSGGYIDFTTLAESATMAAEGYIEYEVIPGASVTA